MGREHRYFVYVLTNKSRTLYVGITNDLPRRIEEHRSGVFEGFTKQYHVTRLVCFEESRYVRDAIAREKQIKGCRRSKKIALVESSNPLWRDLAPEIVSENA